MAAMGHKFVIRVSHVGGLSLAALFTGGTILLLFCVNISTTGRRPDKSTIGFDSTRAVFVIGADLDVQTWLSVLGVGFGLISYGLMGTYTHMFDLWCSFRATRTSSGLDYARYLNSQPYAPVMVGFRGFPIFVMLRYMVLALGLVATVGYPFAVVKITLQNHQHVEEGLVSLTVPPMRAILKNGTSSPWLGDGPLSSGNRAFLHQNPADFFQPPQSIVMVGWADCGDTFDVRDEGMLYTREIVMVADQLEEHHNDTFMTADQSGWLRGETSSLSWSINKTKPAIIDYRISQGKVEIRWAETGDWVNSSSLMQPIVGSVTYKIHFAIDVVQRPVSEGQCSQLSSEDGLRSSIRLVVDTAIPVSTQHYSKPIQLYRNWIDATLFDSQASPLEGISGLIRSVMAEWGTQLSGEDTNTSTIRLGHAPKDPPKRPPDCPESQWLNEEKYHNSSVPFMSTLGPAWNHTRFSTTPSTASKNANIRVRYPIYSGTRATGQVGSYYSVVYKFGAIGVVSYLLIAIRIALGPAKLTSWMG